jgi:hypothetical protein
VGIFLRTWERGFEERTAAAPSPDPSLKPSGA